MNQTASVLMEIPAPTEIFWSIYGYHVNFIASSLSKTGIPHEWSLVLTHVSTFLVAFGIVAVIYMELQYQCWKFLYRLGWLERVQVRKHCVRQVLLSILTEFSACSSGRS